MWIYLPSALLIAVQLDLSASSVLFQSQTVLSQGCADVGMWLLWALTVVVYVIQATNLKLDFHERHLTADALDDMLQQRNTARADVTSLYISRLLSDVSDSIFRDIVNSLMESIEEGAFHSMPHLQYL